jgi:hypothetical protein
MSIPTAVVAWLVAASAPLLIVRAPPAIVRSSAARDAVPEAVIVAQPLRTGAKVRLSASSGMKLTIAVMAGGREVKEFEMPGCTQLCCVASVSSADEAGCTAGELAFGTAGRSGRGRASTCRSSSGSA